MLSSAPSAAESSCYIAALDVGTTSVRCFILNAKCEIVASAAEPVELLNPQPGYFEIEPEALWRKIVHVINNSVKAANLTPSDITCLGISTQRCTFLTWNHRTQEYYHNFITWKDLRADALVDQYNSGLLLKSLNRLSYALYFVTRSKRFLAGSVLKMMNGQITLRLLYELRNNLKLQQAVKAGVARVELLDSWILYKLRSGNGIEPDVEHITDITSCTATGIFDPFTLGWSPFIKHVFGLDVSLLPRIVNNAYKQLGTVHPASLGEDWLHAKRLPITASISDQTASMWGSHCFNDGDLKITMGTGAFLNLMTGQTCSASLMGMYPLVAWQLQSNKAIQDGAGDASAANVNSTVNVETMFCMEGAAHDFGTVITWGQNCGLFVSPAETAAIAETVEHTNGVYFLPAFSGFGAPINDHKAASGFIGITPSTTRAHLIRALLESIAFRLVLLCETVEIETKYKPQLLRVDGGVSRNDFVCQFLADATGKRVERARNTESSIVGATYLAGYNYGIWKMADIRNFRDIERVFEPRTKYASTIKENMQNWLKAVERFGHWY